MAKRPASPPMTEEDVIKAHDPVDPVARAEGEPVTMAEPPRPEPDPAVPPVDDAELADPQPVGPEPLMDKGPVSSAAEPEPVLPPASPPVSSPGGKTAGGGFLATALGGVVAAAAGYALAIVVPFPGMGTSDALPPATQAEVQALAARIDTLDSAPAPDASLAERIAALETRPVPEAPAQQDLAPLTEALAALDTRIAGLESRGPAAPGEAPAADLVALVEELRAEVAEMRSSGADATAGLEALAAQTEARLAEAEAQAAALRAEAEESANKALTAAALGRVQAALESGVPFAGALADVSGVEVPPALASLAETGVPSRAALEDAFPPAARAALEASLRADMGEGWSDRIGAFLQATTGARSLTPREGADPDAVLSRAEAAVKAGDFAQALTELQGLPEAGQAEVADWTAMAQQRLEAVSAAATLSAAVEG